MQRKIVSILLFIAGLVLAIAPLNTDCAAKGKFMKNGMAMGCHYTAIALTIIGVVVVVVSIVAFFAKKPLITVIMYVLAAIAAVAGFLIAHGVVHIGNGVPMKEGGWTCGMCHSPMMPCHTTMLPIANITLAAVIVLALVGLLLRFVGKER